jgi:hypothetical protein
MRGGVTLRLTYVRSPRTGKQFSRFGCAYAPACGSAEPAHDGETVMNGAPMIGPPVERTSGAPGAHTALNSIL